jgi:hypothetical protein
MRSAAGEQLDDVMFAPYLAPTAVFRFRVTTPTGLSLYGALLLN